MFLLVPNEIEYVNPGRNMSEYKVQRINKLERN